MSGWEILVIIALAIVGIWAVFGILTMIFSLIDYHHEKARAARSAEDSTTNRERSS